MKGGFIMDANIMNIITNVGFPIACCLAMGLYIRELVKQHKEEIANLNAKHEEETTKFAEALNKNTLVIQKLCDKMDLERGADNA